MPDSDHSNDCGCGKFYGSQISNIGP